MYRIKHWAYIGYNTHFSWLREMLWSLNGECKNHFNNNSFPYNFLSKPQGATAEGLKSRRFQTPGLSCCCMLKADIFVKTKKNPSPEQEKGPVRRMLKHLSIQSERAPSWTSWLLGTLNHARHQESFRATGLNQKALFIDLISHHQYVVVFFLLFLPCVTFQDAVAGRNGCRRWAGHLPPLQPPGSG